MRELQQQKGQWQMIFEVIVFLDFTAKLDIEKIKSVETQFHQVYPHSGENWEIVRVYR